MAAPMRGEGEQGGPNNFMAWVEKAMAQHDHDDWIRVLQEVSMRLAPISTSSKGLGRTSGSRVS